MENEFFLSAGIPPGGAGTLQFGASSATQSHKWQSLSSAMEILDTELNCSAEPVPDYFLNPSWEKSTDQGGLLESALGSMVSSPAASNSNNLSNDSFVIWELIGSNSVEISPHPQPLLEYMGGAGGDSNSTNTSSYSTPLNSPPKLKLPIERCLPSLAKPAVSNSTVADFTANPGFGERAAKFSCFGSRSINGRKTQLGQTNTELASSFIPNPIAANSKLSPVSSSPSLNAVRSQLGNKNSSPHDRIESRNSSSPEASTVSEHAPPIGESGLKAANDSNSRKRKAAPKGKAKEPSQSPSNNASKVTESNSKRIKTNEGNGSAKAEQEEEETKGSNSSGGDNMQTKTSNSNTKPPGPPKDYIHVRARRGQATDSHSLAERVRREKISERMKFLEDLVPGCNKVTGKALMLDEIINYVQSLQRQVEFLSMKLASINLGVNMDRLLSKDFPTFSEDDLQTVVQMGFGQNPNQEPTLLSQSFLPWSIPSIQHDN